MIVDSPEIIEKNIKDWNIPVPTQDYMVVVQCSTYNHEKYIEDALKGFVMQQTNFPWCVLVTDDCSTDGTTAIVRNYAEQYPDIIKALCLGKNHMQHKIDRGPYIYPWHNRGKYIAICEGDDYWTDPLKLQKQVDFLEGHPEYSMCFHTAEVLTESAEEKKWFPVIEERDYSPREIMAQWCINTCTVMYRRRESVLLNIRNENIVFGDIYMWELLAEAGNVRGLSFCGAVYRRNSNGMSQTINCALARRLAKQYRFMGRRFPIIKNESQNMEDSYLRYLMTHDESDQVWRDVYRLTMHHPHFIFSKYFVKAVSFMFKDVLLK